MNPPISSSIVRVETHFRNCETLSMTGRMGTPQEVAAGVVFLASPVASRISGTNLIIDGALTKAV
jgi:3-oxoacyl-[acyl-carrier protein] reductase